MQEYYIFFGNMFTYKIELPVPAGGRYFLVFGKKVPKETDLGEALNC